MILDSSAVVAIVLREPGFEALVQKLVEASGIGIAFGNEHWGLALEAYERFGEGRHRAALSFGDCLTYAIARRANQPLLCTGGDFVKTDLELA